MLLSPNLYSLHRGQANPLALSPEVWHDVLDRSLAPDGCGGGRIRLYDANDVGAVPTVVTTDFDSVSGQVGVFADVGASLLPSAADPGVAEAVTGATDNNEVYVVSGQNKGADVKVGDGSISFEARVKISALTATSFVAGCVTPDVAADGVILDTEALADKDFVGFHYRATEGLKFVHRANGQAATYVDVKDITTGNDIALTADTWVKLGFKIDQRPRTAAEKVAIFVDNVKVAYVSTSVFDGALFPSTAALAAVLGVKTTAAVTKTLSFSFFGVAQDPVNHG